MNAAQKTVADMEALIAETEQRAALLLNKAGFKTKVHEAMRFGAYALSAQAAGMRATLNFYKATHGAQLEEDDPS